MDGDVRARAASDGAGAKGTDNGIPDEDKTWESVDEDEAAAVR